MKLKKHWKKHKWKYIAGGGVVFAGITCFIMGERYAVLRGGADGPDVATIRSLGDKAQMLGTPSDAKAQLLGTSDISFSNLKNNVFNSSFNKVVNVLERDGRGHPGYMVRCIEEDLTWPSQLKTALAHGVHPKTVSDHLNGRAEHVAGHHLERIQMAA